jgi:hypothetical protein
VAKSECLQAAHEREMHKAVRVKPKMQWRSKKAKDARNMECLLREAGKSKQRMPKRETGVEKVTTYIGVHLMSPHDR